jgi:transcriptional regulator with GAF, ATPase, and Fis domain
VIGPADATRGIIVNRAMSEDEQRFELLADLGAMIAREVELDELLATCAARVARAIGAERATLWVVDGATGELRARLADALDPDDLRLPVGRGVAGAVAATGAPILIADAARDPRWDPAIDRRTGFTTRSMLCVPVRGPDGALRGVLQTLNHTGAGFTGREQVFASALADQIGRALEFTTLRGHRERPGVEVRGRYNHVVGQSPTMRAVYDVIARARPDRRYRAPARRDRDRQGACSPAPSTSTARARPGPSSRSTAPPCRPPWSRASCSATSAAPSPAPTPGSSARSRRRPGGTLFLDELGEIPLELQGKLLRFVQERRFERVGGRTPLSSDVRLVVATNRDLAAMVKAGQFRSDLYFRVRVIEIELPALRSRGPDDVLALAEHFAALYGRRHRTAVPSLSDDARAALLAHTWPGNVRELEHAIERAVVLARGPVIDAAALGLDRGVAAAPVDGVVVPHGLALAEVERRYAAAALAAADGNQSAAARSLAISRNRLARLLKP